MSATVTLDELLKEVPPEVEREVVDVRDKRRNHLQAAMREETRLSMSFAGADGREASTFSVPVKVEPGYPEELGRPTVRVDLKDMIALGRRRRDLLCARESLGFLCEFSGELERLSFTAAPLAEDVLAAEARWLDQLLALLDDASPVRQLLAVDRDILGVYRFGAPSNNWESGHSITLYWGIIGLVSELLGCSASSLATVVLTHELGHAYTHLGADIDGCRWDNQDFHRADLNLVEGLAQYFTERVLTRQRDRFPDALSAYRLLLKAQSGPYLAHLPWSDMNAPEAVRRAMLECRRRRIGCAEQFEARLSAAVDQLSPQA